MSTDGYNRLRDDATRRAHVLRQEALHSFWMAVLRRFRHFTHLEA
jgi:hypothetical protein